MTSPFALPKEDFCFSISFGSVSQNLSFEAKKSDKNALRKCIFCELQFLTMADNDEVTEIHLIPPDTKPDKQVKGYKPIDLAVSVAKQDNNKAVLSIDWFPTLSVKQPDFFGCVALS